MNRLFAIAVKDLRLLFRDRMGLFFVLLFPIIYGVFFGIINSGFSEGGKGTIALAVVDDDHSTGSEQFIAQLKKSSAVELATMPDRDQAADAVRRAKKAAYVRLPKGFGESAGLIGFSSPDIEVGIDPSRSAESGLLQGVLMEAAVGLMRDRFTNPAAMREQIARTRSDLAGDKELPGEQKLILGAFLGALDTFMGSMSPAMMKNAPDMAPAKVRTVDVTIAASDRDKLLKKLRSPYELTFPSAMMWGLMGCASGFAVSLVKERRDGTLLRMQVAPLRRGELLAGKALACFMACLFVIVVMLIFGRMLGMRWGRPAILAAAMLSASFCWVGVMMLLSVIGRTEQAVAGASWAVLVVLAMIGGGMVPLIFLPKFMQQIAVISPIRWGIEALEGAIWRGYSPAEMVRPCAVLLAIGAAALVTGTTIFERRAAA